MTSAWCATHATGDAALPAACIISAVVRSTATARGQHRPIEGQLHEQLVHLRAPRREEHNYDFVFFEADVWFTKSVDVLWSAAHRDVVTYQESRRAPLEDF